MKQPIFDDTWPDELRTLADAMDATSGDEPVSALIQALHHDAPDGLDILIDGLPAVEAPAPHGQVLTFGTTAGKSLKQLVGHVQQNFPDTRHDTKKLLLQIWKAQGAVIPSTLETYILRYCAPPEAITRTARPYYTSRQQATR